MRAVRVLGLPPPDDRLRRARRFLASPPPRPPRAAAAGRHRLGSPPQRAGRVRRIVCDTGPLLHLFEASLLTVLNAAGEIVVPLAVATELENLAPGPQLRD